MNELLRRMLLLPEQASTFAREIDGLHYLVIGWTMAGSTVVLVLALIFLAMFRRRKGERYKKTPYVHIAFSYEVGLALGLLLLFMVFWVVGFRQFMRMTTPPAEATQVYVTAKQWMWKFAYPEGPSSVGVLYVPANRPVKLLITSRDVIHSFFVPAFRVKKDAVPGRYTVAWFEATKPGTYRVFCTEYCGTHHSRMLAEVVVLSGPDFDRWLESPTAPVAGVEPFPRVEPPPEELPVWAPQARAGLAAQGRVAAAEHGCLRCHSIDGTRHIGPSFVGLYGSVSRMIDGEQVVVDEAYITESMMDPMRRLVSGYAPVMPSYLGLISAGDTAAIVEYIRYLRTDNGVQEAMDFADDWEESP